MSSSVSFCAWGRGWSDRLLYTVVIQIIAGHLREVEWEIGCAGSHASSRVLRPSASPLVATDPVSTPGGGGQRERGANADGSPGVS